MLYKQSIPKSRKIPKTREVFVVQGNYGSGWEDVTEETSYFGGKNRLHEYNENESYPHRIIHRRVPFFELSESDKESNKKEWEAYKKRQEEKKLNKTYL